ncbi:MAG TPA: nucleotidyltransferase domain-containing protein, partial [Lacipirellulaceae bacterium]|nr:nucleotidyltransferase domain-containing protein [Lacipirellulaceae bacterium]
DALLELCKRYTVKSLELCSARPKPGEFVPGPGDLDFLVEFDRPPGTNAFRQFFGFREALTELFGVEIDLVVATAMRNPYFIRRVNESRTPIYAA